MLSALAALTVAPLMAQLPPATEPVTEPVVEPAAESAVDPAAESLADPTANPLVNPATDPATNSQTVVIPRGPAYAEVIRYQDVRPLPGQLDDVPVFNSNSPELVQREGILLSTLPTDGMGVPEAHLDYAFNGRFDIFAHHVARGLTPDDRRTLFFGVLLYNPSSEPVTVRVLQGVSYLSQEAPFQDLPPVLYSATGSVFAGPGSRTATELLRGVNQAHWPESVTIPPGHVHLLMNMPIPLRRLSVPVDGTHPQGDLIPQPPQPTTGVTVTQVTDDGDKSEPPRPISNRSLPSNGRTAMMYLDSDGPVHVASLATYARRTPSGNERVPTLRDWIRLLKEGGFAGPRDAPPSNPETYRYGRFYYGRVAGVATGSRWSATLTDTPDTELLSIPTSGDAYSYVISSVDRNTFGTGQIQSAPILSRYGDTAYRAHGNYGIHYSLRLPLHNDTGEMQTVALKFQTPLQDESLTDGLRFLRPPEDRIFFRGTVRLQFTNDLGIERTQYLHLVQRRGQEGDTLLQFNMPADARRDIAIDFVYPPDATPPHVVTVENLGQFDRYNPLRSSLESGVDVLADVPTDSVTARIVDDPTEAPVTAPLTLLPLEVEPTAN